jgi:hypothetical protein
MLPQNQVFKRLLPQSLMPPLQKVETVPSNLARHLLQANLQVARQSRVEVETMSNNEEQKPAEENPPTPPTPAEQPAPAEQLPSEKLEKSVKV